MKNIDKIKEMDDVELSKILSLYGIDRCERCAFWKANDCEKPGYENCQSGMHTWLNQEHIESPKTIADLKEGDTFHYIDSFGNMIVDCKYCDTYKPLIDIGGAFLTREDTEREIAKQKATTAVKKRIAELNDGWEPDWNREDDYKYYIYYNYATNCLATATLTRYKSHTNDVCLKNDKLACLLVEEMSEELKIMLEV